VPKAEGLANLSLAKGISVVAVPFQRELLREFDALGRAVDADGGGTDAYTQRALEMITSPKARQAFDLSKEPAEARARYGKFCENFLLARRLVEAGINVVTLKVGDWDTHEKNFIDMREQLPQLDQGFHALVTDLHEPGPEDLTRRRPRPLAGGRRRRPRRRRVQGRPGNRRDRFARRTVEGQAVYTQQRPRQSLSSPGHRPGNDHPRPHAPADACAR
jgi:hypothetical protein